MAERISFERSLYLPEAVEAAAAAYSEYARIDVTTEPDAVVAVVEPTIAEEGENVAHAFCNHVLHETITRRRQASLEEFA
jgi:hypothetical protein